MPEARLGRIDILEHLEARSEIVFDERARSASVVEFTWSDDVCRVIFMAPEQMVIDDPLRVARELGVRLCDTLSKAGEFRDFTMADYVKMFPPRTAVVQTDETEEVAA